MKKLFRLFSQDYPYLYRTNSYHKAINSFPLSFSSHETVRPTDLSLTPDFDDFVGVKQVYEVFIKSLYYQDLSNLKNLVEYNFLYRIEEALRNLSENGFTMHLVGNLESVKIIEIKDTVYAGSILPQRNLNFPSEYYEISKIDKNKDDSIYFYKTLSNSKLSLDNYKDLDLDEINQSDCIYQYRHKMSEILAQMNHHPIMSLTTDYGISTNYKIIIKDKTGTTIAGNDSEEFEFHTIRIEEFSYKSNFLDYFVRGSSAAKRFFNQKLGNYLNQYTLIDIDGFMKGNLIIPQH